MSKKDRYLVALDVGSTKTCALIADLEGGHTKFLAMGAAESKGNRKGLIVNLDAAASSIRAGGNIGAWSKSLVKSAVLASTSGKATLLGGSGSAQWKYVNRVRSGRKQR